jgi:hypothetical protein
MGLEVEALHPTLWASVTNVAAVCVQHCCHCTAATAAKLVVVLARSRLPAPVSVWYST